MLQPAYLSQRYGRYLQIARERVLARQEKAFYRVLDTGGRASIEPLSRYLQIVRERVLDKRRLSMEYCSAREGFL
jgi:hypothetical protein